MADPNRKTDIAALLTGRGNNTFPDKNIRPVCGKPLLYYPAVEAKRTGQISHFYVSSDCDKILDAAAGVGYKKIRRPEEFARPDSQHVDVVYHALDEMEKDGVQPEILVVLLANHVTIKSQWIEDCIQKVLEHPEITACVPVYREMDHHPYRAKRLDSDGVLQPFVEFDSGKVSTNRQDLPACYFLCHNFWVLDLGAIRREEGPGQPPWTFMGSRVVPYEVDEAFDVHDADDLERSAKWLEKEGMIPDDRE